MPPRPADEQSLSRRELARRAGVSEGTLRNWETEHDPALRTRRGSRRSVSSTVTDVRAFCAAHPDLPAARRAVANLDRPTGALDIESLRTVLEAVLTAVRASTAAHVDLADHTTILCRNHSAALNSALRGLDDALTRITAARPQVAGSSPAGAHGRDRSLGSGGPSGAGSPSQVGAPPGR